MSLRCVANKTTQERRAASASRHVPHALPSHFSPTPFPHPPGRAGASQTQRTSGALPALPASRPTAPSPPRPRCPYPSRPAAPASAASRRASQRCVRPHTTTLKTREKEPRPRGSLLQHRMLCAPHLNAMRALQHDRPFPHPPPHTQPHSKSLSHKAESVFGPGSSRLLTLVGLLFESDLKLSPNPGWSTP
eukprot:359308-Chlamydomonas_euryale.AAC.1